MSLCFDDCLQFLDGGERSDVGDADDAGSNLYSYADWVRMV